MKRHILLSTLIRAIKYYRVLNLIFLFTLFINEAKSQYAIAGIKGAIYVDIIPDTLLKPYPASPNLDSSQYYYIDINQDGNKDIEIHAKMFNGLSVSILYVNVSSLDTNTNFSFLRADSIITGWPCKAYGAINILKPYSIGDSIQNANYVATGYLSYASQYISCFPNGERAFIDTSDHYIGVRYSDISGISYGWIRVNVSNYQTVLIKDFSLGVPFVGVMQYSVSNQLNIFPNPVADKLYIMQIMNPTEDIEISLFDIIGKEVCGKTKGEKITEINVSGLAEGIYFVQVKTREGVLTKKIVVR